MDVDSMRKKFAYEKFYEKIENGETDIIVGTQMVSKGLDFPNIELIAIPRADSLLHIQDFRIEERAYQPHYPSGRKSRADFWKWKSSDTDLRAAKTYFSAD